MYTLYMKDIHITATYDTFRTCIDKGYFSLAKMMVGKMKRYSTKYGVLIKREYAEEEKRRHKEAGELLVWR